MTAARSNLTERLLTAWYGLIYLVLLAAVIYAYARGNPLTSPPLATSLGIFIFFSILALRTATRLFACLALTTLVVPFYLFESYLWLTAAPKAPDRSGVKARYVAELREEGTVAYPSVTPAGFRWLLQRAGDSSRSPIVVEGREILPLAGVSDVLTVYCQAKDWSMVTYRSDGFGFRNPSLAGQSAAPEFALLGDSFVQGYCVPGAVTYAERLAALGPAANYGMNGTSPLAQVAIYREYVKALRPKRVLWFFYEGNDLEDYLGERRWPLLRAYLDRDHVQNLARLNGAISSALKRFIDEQLESVEVATITDDQIGSGNSISSQIGSFLLLRRARSVLGHEIDRTTDFTEAEWREMDGLWREVVETQRTQGGETTFVYIPARDRFTDPAPYQAIEQKVVALWSNLGADYVLLTEPLEAVDDPLKYYGDADIHFNEEGYRLTADAIVEHLARSTGG